MKLAIAMAVNMKWHAQWQSPSGNYTGTCDNICIIGTANAAGNDNETKHGSGNGDGNGNGNAFALAEPALAIDVALAITFNGNGYCDWESQWPCHRQDKYERQCQ
jgi:hypothetical protein